MIYLASPYTAANPLIMETRYLEACAAVAAFTDERTTTYAPIAHYHVVAKFGELPTDFQFWSGHNRHMLNLAEALWVLILPGWETSVGVAAEIEYAAEIYRPIKAAIKTGPMAYRLEMWGSFVDENN